jgi:hypothetical protein
MQNDIFLVAKAHTNSRTGAFMRKGRRYPKESDSRMRELEQNGLVTRKAIHESPKNKDAAKQRSNK